MAEFSEATQLQRISEIINQHELKLVKINKKLDNILTKEYLQEQLEFIFPRNFN